MRALVTGCKGFIGRYLVDELASAGWQVVGVESEDSGVDIRDRDAVTSWLRDASPEVVFHLAGISGPMVAPNSPGLVAEVNCVGTINVLEACKSTHASRFIYASSVSGFDGGSKDSPHPTTVYGATKRFGEMVCSTNASEAIECTSCRIGSVYGPGRKTRDIVDTMIVQVKREGYISYDPNGVVALVHVKDVANCLSKLASIEEPPKYCDVVSEQVSEEDVAMMVARAAGLDESRVLGERSGGAVYPGGFSERLFEDLIRPCSPRLLTETLPGLF